jgi:hypothetical protein
MSNLCNPDEFPGATVLQNETADAEVRYGRDIVDEALPSRCIDNLKALGQPPFWQTQGRRSRRPPRADHLLEVTCVSHLAAMATQGCELAFDGRRDVHAVRRPR